MNCPIMELTRSTSMLLMMVELREVLAANALFDGIGLMKLHILMLMVRPHEFLNPEMCEKLGLCFGFYEWRTTMTFEDAKCNESLKKVGLKLVRVHKMEDQDEYGDDYEYYSLMMEVVTAA
jgi:hypothetical protein